MQLSFHPPSLGWWTEPTKPRYAWVYNVCDWKHSCICRHWILFICLIQPHWSLFRHNNCGMLLNAIEGNQETCAEKINWQRIQQTCFAENVPPWWLLTEAPECCAWRALDIQNSSVGTLQENNASECPYNVLTRTSIMMQPSAGTVRTSIVIGLFRIALGIIRDGMHIWRQEKVIKFNALWLEELPLRLCMTPMCHHTNCKIQIIFCLV